MGLLLSSSDEEGRRRRRRFIIAALLMRKKMKFYHRLNEEGCRRRCRNIPRNSLNMPSNSAWEALYQSGDDGALITVTGFDHPTFAFILQLFIPNFNAFTPWVGHGEGFKYARIKEGEKRGRKRIIIAAACLGLVLAWYRFKGGEFVLQGWFGFTGGHTNTWLRFGRSSMLLLSILHLEEARVGMPTEEKVKFYQEAIAARHSSLVNVYCFADGLKLPFQSCEGLTE